MSSFRRRRAERADAQAVAELVAAADVAILGSTDFSVSDLEDEWRELDLARNAWVVLDGERIVGYGTVEERPAFGAIDGYVHPDAFGRGVGTLLVVELERELAARGVGRVQSATLSADARAYELLLGLGYEEVRRFWQMRFTLEREPAVPTWPEGADVTAFEPADAEAFHEAYEDAFADHWQHDGRSFDEWQKEHIGRDDFSPGLWTVVRADGEIVGGTICLPERNGVAWVSRLFTRRDWRRRGLGEALLHDAFGKFWDAGKRSVGLGVDAQSDTGAQRLYERVGMHVHWGAVVFEKDLA